MTSILSNEKGQEEWKGRKDGIELISLRTVTGNECGFSSFPTVYCFFFNRCERCDRILQPLDFDVLILQPVGSFSLCTTPYHSASLSCCLPQRILLCERKSETIAAVERNPKLFNANLHKQRKKKKTMKWMNALPRAVGLTAPALTNSRDSYYGGAVCVRTVITLETERIRITVDLPKKNINK